MVLLKYAIIYKHIYITIIVDMSDTILNTKPKIIPVNQMTAKTNIHLGYDLIKRLKHHVIDNDMTFSSVVNVALNEYLDKRYGT